MARPLLKKKKKVTVVLTKPKEVARAPKGFFKPKPDNTSKSLFFGEGRMRV